MALETVDHAPEGWAEIERTSLGSTGYPVQVGRRRFIEFAGVVPGDRDDHRENCAEWGHCVAGPFPVLVGDAQLAADLVDGHVEVGQTRRFTKGQVRGNARAQAFQKTPFGRRLAGPATTIPPFRPMAGGGVRRRLPGRRGRGIRRYRNFNLRLICNCNWLHRIFAGKPATFCRFTGKNWRDSGSRGAASARTGSGR